MTKEAYCSFEVAKLLKEKGFEGECRAYYKVFPSERIAAICYSRELRKISEDGPNEILCPTHQVACAWLREAHDIHISAWIMWHGKSYGGDISVKGKDGGYTYRKVYHLFKSHEEAIEALIKYTLENLI